MDSYLAIIIIGIYTIIYLIVFFVQKSQIDKIKEISNIMNTYMGIFKIDEVKKYVSLKEENSILEAASFITNHQNVKKVVDSVYEARTKVLQDFYMKQKGEEFIELTTFALNTIGMQPIEDRRKIVETYLPKSSHFIVHILEEEGILVKESKENED